MYIPKFQCIDSKNSHYITKTAKQQPLYESNLACINKEVNFQTHRIQKEKKKLASLQDLERTLKQEIHVIQKSFQSNKMMHQQQDYINNKSQSQSIKQSYNKTQTTINHTQNENNHLINQINSTRRERVNLLKQKKELCETIKTRTEYEQQLEQSIKESNEQIKFFRSMTYNNKVQQDKKDQDFLDEIGSFQQQIEQDKIQKKFIKKDKEQVIIQNQDITKIQSIRLKRIIKNNKQKVKIIDEYIKKMQQTEYHFNKIKEMSGNQDLEELAQNFIKSDQQYYQLYQLMDQINQDIERLNEKNENLEQKISQQKDELNIKENQQKQIENLQLHEQDKQNKIDILENEQYRFNNILKGISPFIKELLIILSALPYQQQRNKFSSLQYIEDFQINENNQEYYLGELETLLNNFFLERGFKQLIASPVQRQQRTLFNQQINEDFQLNTNFNHFCSENQFQQISTDILKKKKLFKNVKY